MNAIGKIGAIIIKYQYQIEIALLSLLALIVLIGLIKLIISALRRKDVLSEIKVTVTDIDSTVLMEEDTQEDDPKLETGFSEDKRFENVLENLLINSGNRDVHCAEEGELSKKFVSRECGTDKYGNVYTEEFLSKQIK